MSRPHPPPSADERTTLEAFLDHQRATLLMKVEGLDRQQLNQRLPTSQLTLAGLLKHLALVEDDWIQVRFCGRPELEPWASAPWEQDRDWDFHTAEHDEPNALRALYQDACARSRSAIATTDLDTLSIGHDRDGQQWSLRWVLTHLVEETARHNGHASPTPRGSRRLRRTVSQSSSRTKGCRHTLPRRRIGCGTTAEPRTGLPYPRGTSHGSQCGCR